MNEQVVGERTLDWVRQFVVGLSLCPFASAPLQAGLIHVRVSEAQDEEALAADLITEVEELLARSRAERETTLLVHPQVLQDFDAYLDFLEGMQPLWEEAGLEGLLQIASFHPDYRFADSPEDDPANASNQSPYPMLHLLREESVSDVIDRHPDPDGIPKRNVKLLRHMGYPEIRKIWR